MQTNSVFKRIYYDDTDAGGVVYHANYLRYLDHARSDFLRQLDYPLDKILAEHNVVFAVTGLTINYKQPAKLCDELEITASIKLCRKIQLVFEQEVWRLDEKKVRQVLLSDAVVNLACLQADSFKPTRIPNALEEQLNSVN